MIDSTKELLLGRKILLNGGNVGTISDIFDLAEGMSDQDSAWIIEVTIELKRGQFLFDPKLGISLSGRRLFPWSLLQRAIL